MLSTKQFLVTAAFMLSYFATFAFGKTFTGNTVLNGLTIFILPVTVSTDANLVIQSGLIHNFFNTITNRGGLYICETKAINVGMTVLAAGNINNYGTFVVDDSTALTGLTFKSAGIKFYNAGEFFVYGKKPLITGSVFRIWALSFHNEGLMAFYQNGSSDFLSTVELGPETLIDALHVTNTGTICLRSINMHARVAFEGEDGCIDVGAYSTLTVNHLISRSVKSQTIYMSDESSVVYVKSLLGLTSLTVRGWGNNNKIYFGITVLYYTYNTASGILTVIDGLNFIRIDIGTGYDQSNMFRTTNHLLIGSGIAYNAPAPDASRPANCAECTEVPDCQDALNAESSVSTESNTFTNTDLPSPYTTTVSASGTTETQLISFFWTTDSAGSSFPVETVYTLTGSAASSLDAESKTVSSSVSSVESSVAASSAASSVASVESSVESSSVAASSVVSSVASSAASSSASGSLSYYTTTKADASTTETLIVSDYTTTDNNGNTVTLESTYTITASQAPLTTYTTTVVVDGTTSVYVVCDYTTTDANGNTVTLVSSYPCITDGTATTYTRTITAEICTSTVVVCTCTSTKSNGETVSTLTTYPATYTPTDMSGDSYTTTVVVGGTVTEVVECDYLTTDSAGNTYTAHSTVTETSLTTTTETVCETCTATATNAGKNNENTNASASNGSKNGANTASEDTTTTITNTAVSTKTASQVVEVQSASSTATANNLSEYEGSASNMVVGSWIAMASAFVFLLF
ncbi:similar to Kazachstania africana KAFR_0I01780 hypothetical protein [Maudiozyma saulgeensis]|uniref:Hyphally-regulated cell wall protein N-terminal domain-containing protein n=1 Tax=Maudiozyma saulgeensis TaxID=1789683 RepID=A0A1X7QY06_9SACH|nr:similar to Kazachstania africana KAFR_0I01780 hypothetical protein [Kazachstania saulgeensis]